MSSSSQPAAKLTSTTTTTTTTSASTSLSAALNHHHTNTRNRPDLTFRPARLYRSYLNYSAGCNPFESNYDVVSRKKNTELVSDSTYRFNRAASSLSMLSHSVEMKRFSAATAMAATTHAREMMSAAATTTRPPHASATAASRLLNEASLIVEESKSGIERSSVAPTVRKSSAARNLVKPNTTTTNQFLNYRTDESTKSNIYHTKIQINKWLKYVILLRSNKWLKSEHEEI